MLRQAKRKLQFSLRTILLLTLFAAPVSVYIAHVSSLPETAELVVSLYSDDTVEIDGRRDTLEKMIPKLNREVLRRQHFDHGVELRLNSFDEATLETRARVIDAAEKAGRVNLVKVYPVGDTAVPLTSIRIQEMSGGHMSGGAMITDSTIVELSQETKGNNQE